MEGCMYKERIVQIISIIICVLSVAYLINGFKTVKTQEAEYVAWANAENQLRQEQLEAEEEAELEAQAQAELEALVELENTSSFYQKLSNGFDVNILILGDSMATGTDELSWTSLLENSLEEEYSSDVTVTNLSVDVDTAYSGYVKTMLLDDEIEYDLAIVCYGENDNASNFSIYYENVIRAINDKYEKCSIISIMESSQQEYTEKMLAIQSIASHYNNIELADTIATFEVSDLTYEELTDDGIIPNEEGQQIYFETINSVITTNVDYDTDYNSDDIEPLNEEVFAFDSLIYILASDFERIDDYTLSIDTDSMTGSMGIYYSYETGENSLEIYIDDALITTKEATSDYDFSQTYIDAVDENVIVEENITLVFAEKEQADNFEALVFNITE